jgi:DNA invertase Pin-like site-specific DNA recombinase
MKEAVAVIYMLTTASHGKGGAALARQRLCCRQVARQLDVPVVQEFVDLGVTGDSPERPGFASLCIYLTDHPTDYVITADLARLAPWRSAEATLRHFQELGTSVVVDGSCGAQVVAPNGG